MTASGVCPKCDGGHQTPCYVEYPNGSWCFSCHYLKLNHCDYKPNTKLPPRILPSNLEVTFDPREFPPQALQYLYDYNIFKEDIIKHSIGYIPQYNELLYVLSDNYQISRGLDKKSYRTYGVKPEIMLFEYIESDTLVIVEDYLSAVRLSEYAHVLFLAGTSLKTYPSLWKYKKILVWLDDDYGPENPEHNPGQTAAAKIIKQLNFLHKTKCPYINATIRNIANRLEPKACSSSEILEILNY